MSVFVGYRTNRGIDRQQAIPAVEVLSGEDQCVYDRWSDTYGTLA
jgi:hypothetical protein